MVPAASSEASAASSAVASGTFVASAASRAFAAAFAGMPSPAALGLAVAPVASSEASAAVASASAEGMPLVPSSAAEASAGASERMQSVEVAVAFAASFAVASAAAFAASFAVAYSSEDTASGSAVAPPLPASAAAMLQPAENSEDLGKRQSAVQSLCQEAEMPVSPAMLAGSSLVLIFPFDSVSQSQC